MNHLPLVLVSIIVLLGCSGPKETVTIEEHILDTLMVTAPRISDDQDEADYTLPRYNPSQTRSLDILHTKLDLRFNWEKEQVFGKAWLTLKPYFYPTDKLVLDAKDFVINTVRLGDKGPEIPFQYDGVQLSCYPGTTYTRSDTLTIYIEYVAHPSGKEQAGAIGSDQGLFFINPRGEDPDKPMQIWTQGETEYNSRWFPTVDQPNERTTQEMILTVDDRFETLSNGVLTDSRTNDDGTRTDYWKMDLPHAPYLFMLAIGEYAVVKDEWRNREVGYYVEPEFGQYARDIFSNTPEMLEFFSEKLGVEYPWPKYSQVVVRDYVSGAMENTSAVIYGEFVQKTDRELIDNNNDRIVAHEMFHQWFGDLVTCESWANLTLNEGFANYSEYLWYEHKYGKEAADNLLRGDMNGYINASRRGIHPLIHYGYGRKESMFDAHSYNKGGVVLHMLRNEVGDEAFFAGLRKYLLDNAYMAVEADELRLAFEDVTGEDLNWFFDQWYFSAGHPMLDIRYEYPSENKVLVIIEQKQDPESMPPVFQLPMKLDMYLADDLMMREEIFMDERIDTFSFDVPNKPLLVNVDADKVLLAEKVDNKSHVQWIYQYYHGPLFMDRWEAFQQVKDQPDTDSRQLVRNALNDSFWGIRQQAIASVDIELAPTEVIDTIRQRAVNDVHSKVRAIAARVLAETGNSDFTETLINILERDQAYPVVASALEGLIDLNIEKALAYAQNLEQSENGQILLTIAEIYREDPAIDHIAFYETAIDKVSSFNAIRFLSVYSQYLRERGKDSVKKHLDIFMDIAMDSKESKWKRFGATKALHDLRLSYVEEAGNKEEGPESDMAKYLADNIEKILAWESDSQLQSIYQQLSP